MYGFNMIAQYAPNGTGFHIKISPFLFGSGVVPILGITVIRKLIGNSSTGNINTGSGNVHIGH